MSAVRLGAPAASGGATGRSRARAAFDLAQEFADAAAALAGHPGRALPELGDFAVGDVLAVCVHDLVEELTAADEQRRAQVCASAVAHLIALRRSL